MLPNLSDRGRIIVTTYDQLLSGLLDQPYGLSDRLHNINAAAIAGALIVFDEYLALQLPPDRGSMEAVPQSAIGLRSPHDAVPTFEQVLVESLGDLAGLGGAEEHRVSRA